MILTLEGTGKGLELTESRNEIGKTAFGVGDGGNGESFTFIACETKPLFRPFYLIQTKGHILLLAVCLWYEAIP
jgi:hypothetical protein